MGSRTSCTETTGKKKLHSGGRKFCGWVLGQIEIEDKDEDRTQEEKRKKKLKKSSWKKKGKTGR